MRNNFMTLRERYMRKLHYIISNYGSKQYINVAPTTLTELQQRLFGTPDKDILELINEFQYKLKKIDNITVTMS